MALVNAFGEMSLESTQQQLLVLQQQVADLAESILYLATSIREHMPRVDSGDRLVVNVAESTGQIYLAGAYNANTAVSYAYSHQNFDSSNAGSARLYPPTEIS